MKPLQIHSERYSATGNIASAGVANQLGRPALDPLAVLVREAVQNCWDARLPGSPTIAVEIELVDLSEAARAQWSELVFADDLPTSGARARLEELETPYRVLFISDRGTAGLGGPTRADSLDDDHEPRDFVDFLRNLGQPPDKALGGGTFGFGKAALYAPSRCHTILVHTRCRRKGGLESRLIAAALGQPFVTSTARYTGRHWWGEREGELANPLLNRRADQFAAALGLPGFASGQTGTTIAILDFTPGVQAISNGDHEQERSSSEAVAALGEAVLWNFWPKMIPVGQDAPPPIRFALRHNGEERALPRPEDDPGLAAMVRALHQARAGTAMPDGVSGLTTTRHIQYRNRHVGTFVAERFISLNDRRKPPPAHLGAPALAVAHHIAWMRSAELIVRYEAGPPFENAGFGYAGVFVVASDRVPDRAFAAAEPPTHDQWHFTNIQDAAQRALVRTSLKRLRDALNLTVRPNASADDDAPRHSLGAIATALGDVLAGVPGGAAGFRLATPRVTPTIAALIDSSSEDEEAPPPTPKTSDGTAAPPERAEPAGQGDPTSTTSKRNTPGKPRIWVSEPRLEVQDGIGVLRLDVTVRHGAHTTGSRVLVRTGVELEGGTLEGSGPEGALTAGVYAWHQPDRQVLLADGDSIFVPLDQAGRWSVDVRLLDDAQLQVAIDVAAVVTDAPEPT